MKKWLLALLSMMMVLTMLFSFAACGDDKAPVNDDDDDEEETSVTTTTVADDDDTTTTTTAAKKEETKDEEATVVGTWETELDAAMLSEIFEGETIKMTIEFKKNGKYIQSFDLEKALELSAMAQDCTVEEFLEEQGMTEDEAYAYLEENMTIEGTYTFEDGELTMNDEVEEYELDGDTLTLIEEGGTFVMTRK